MGSGGPVFVKNNEKQEQMRGFPLAFCAFCHYNVRK
jgi:hypothetical protein